MIPNSDDGLPGLERRAPRAVRLVGDADAVAWVVASLRTHGIAAAADPSAGAGEGPIVWVARPGETPGPEARVADAAVWSIPSLIVVPPGGQLPETLAGMGAVESFEIVREPEDAPVLALRIERLLLLHRRKTQTEIVLHNLSDVVYTRSFEGILTSVNAAGERLFGRRREDLVGHPLAKVAGNAQLPHDIVPRTNAQLHATGRAGGRITFRDHHGRSRVFDRDALLLRDGHGHPVGVQVILSDVTDEIAARGHLELVAERNEVLAAIASAARDSLDLEKILVEATALLGHRLGALSVRVWLVDERPDTYVLASHWRRDLSLPALTGERSTFAENPHLRRLVETLEPAVVRDVAADPSPPAFVARLLERLGASSLVSVPVHHKGEMIGLLGLAWREPRRLPSDELVFLGRVADQIALAVRAARLYARLQKQVAELAEAERRREEADRGRERLSAMLVHDLKNPLTAVTAALELTLEKVRATSDERLARLLEGSLASARSLQGLIEDALLVYRPGDAPRPEHRPVSLAEALSVPFEEARWQAGRRRITFRTELDEGLPTVALDLPRFRRAAANLLGNALKFTPSGGEVVASAGLRPDGDHGTELVFAVADTGPGIPEALRGQLATPWLRLHATERIPGTGLGLAVVQQVARDHGGRLEVGGQDGKGARFSIVFPAGCLAPTPGRS